MNGTLTRIENISAAVAVAPYQAGRCPQTAFEGIPVSPQSITARVAGALRQAQQQRRSRCADVEEVGVVTGKGETQAGRRIAVGGDDIATWGESQADAFCGRRRAETCEQDSHDSQT